MSASVPPIEPPHDDSIGIPTATGWPSRPRVLILGGSGMLGHKVWQTLRPRMETHVALRRASDLTRHAPLDAPDRIIDGFDATRPDVIDAVVARVAPDVIVNAVGAIKQRLDAHEAVTAIEVNALLPHRLARAAAASGARVIHVSTDCVFSGVRGGYRETDTPDATDLYGRSKLLGELDAPGTLTLRTSLIGRELSRQTGLLEWFLSRRRGEADGFTHAIFSGLTTPVFATLIADLIERHPDLSGLYHVAAAPIDKHRLLCLLNDAFDAGVRIQASDALRIDRSLDGSRFRDATGFVAPSWEAMTAELAADPTPYDQWKEAP